MLTKAARGFGLKLRIFRSQVGITQAQLGRILNVKQEIVSYYELGQMKPTAEMMKKIKALMELDDDVLFSLVRSGESEIEKAK